MKLDVLMYALVYANGRITFSALEGAFKSHKKITMPSRVETELEPEGSDERCCH